MIPYCKAHACGNDFLIVESLHVDPNARREEAKRLCARNTGVGADGVEYFEWTGDATAPSCCTTRMDPLQRSPVMERDV